MFEEGREFENAFDHRDRRLLHLVITNRLVVSFHGGCIKIVIFREGVEEAEEKNERVVIVVSNI